MPHLLRRSKSFEYASHCPYDSLLPIARSRSLSEDFQQRKKLEFVSSRNNDSTFQEPFFPVDESNVTCFETGEETQNTLKAVEVQRVHESCVPKASDDPLTPAPFLASVTSPTVQSCPPALSSRGGHETVRFRETLPLAEHPLPEVHDPGFTRDPLRLSRFLTFPVQVGDHGAEIHIFDGMVNHNYHDIKLTRPGYYGLRLHNQNEPAWDSLYLGIGRMKVIAEFEVIRPTLLATSNSDDLSGNVFLPRTSTQQYTRHAQVSFTPAAQAQYPVVEHGTLERQIEDGESESSTGTPARSSRARSPEFPHRMSGLTQDDSGGNLVASASKRNTHRLTRNASATVESGAPFVEHDVEELSSRAKHLPEAIEVIIGAGQLVARGRQEKLIYLFVKDAGSLLKLQVYASLALGMRLKCSYDLLYCGAPRLIPLNPQVPFLRKPNILCLDGGGVLGISSLKILERLELEIQKYVNSSSVRLVDCFDMICGTSTGGIITLGLLSGLSIQYMINMWASISGRIFEGHRTLFSGIFFEGYDIERLKTALVQSLGKRFLNTYHYPYCFVTTTNVKHNPYELFLLRNYSHHHLASNEHRGASSVPVWTAAWATSAAPTYLKGPNPQELESMGFIIHPEVQLCDGAMKANNPTMVALEEAARLTGKRLQHFIHSDLGVLVSVGTGQPTLKQTIDKTGSVSTFQILMNSAHLLTSSTTVHRDVLHWMDDYEDRYFRFNVPGIGDTPLDSCSKSSYDIIIKATNDYLTDEKYYDVKRLVHQLASCLS